MTDKCSYADPYTRPIEYSPSDPILLDRDIQKAKKILRPHMEILKFVVEKVQGAKYRGVGLMGSVVRMLQATFGACDKLR
jgi:phosphatidylinositol 4-kinase